MKPTDKAIVRMVSKLPGRNESKPTSGLETKLRSGSRAPCLGAKAAWPGRGLTEATGHSGGVVGTAR